MFASSSAIGTQPPRTPAGVPGQQISASSPSANAEVPSSKTAGQIARDVLVWLQRADCCGVDRHGRLHLEPWLHLSTDDVVCQKRRLQMRVACPGLDDAMARTLCQTFIDRAHAERADPKAVQNGLESQIRRVLELMRENRHLYSVRAPDGAPHLMYLRAPHYDGCLFNPSASIRRGGSGSFMVGLTPCKHPVAVKMLLRENSAIDDAARKRLQTKRMLFTREASLTRLASSYDVLQLLNTERYQFMVLPLFNGDLKEHGHAFFSLYSPPTSAGCHKNGLFGARYVLRHLVTAAAEWHDVLGLVHEDIKAGNIFLKCEERRFVLGDLGISSVLGEDNQTRVLGYTSNFAAPEQLNVKQPIGAKVDIFGLSTTMFHLLTTQCPPVVAYRAQHFPEHSAPGLFPVDDKFDIRSMHKAHRQVVFEALDGSRDGSSNSTSTPQVRRYQAHLQSIHRSVDYFDRPLGDLLRQMANHDPAMRPRAADVGRYMDAHLTIDADSRSRVLNAWDKDVPRFTEPVKQRLQELSRAIDAITPRSR